MFLFLLLNLGALLKVQAQQGGVVLTSSAAGELCFGQTVTLTCTHPDPFQDPAKYLPVAISWAENSVVLDFSVPATRQRFRHRGSSTASNVSFTVTKDYHAIKVSCYLSLAGGEREESNSISIDVEELSPLFLTSTSSRITVERLAINDCYCSYNISWECTEPSSNGSISTANTSITVPVNGSAECTLRVVGINAEGSFAGPNTTAVVYPGFPRPANASSSTLSCTNRSLLLTCQFGGGNFTDIQWTSSRGPEDSSDGTLLTIDDATILQQGTKFWCSGVPVGGTATYRVRGESYVHNESLTCKTTPPGGDSTAVAAAGAAGGVLAVVAVVVIVVVAACRGVVVYRRRSTSQGNSVDNEDLDVPYQDEILSVLEKKGVKVVEKTAGAFVGTFRSVQFLAVCRAEPIRDITEIDINRVLAITTSTPVKSRLYLCNTNTIPTPRLLQLEKGGGMFVRAFGHVSGEPPGQSWTERVEVNFLRACNDWLELPTPKSSSKQKEEGEISVVPPRLEEGHGELAGPSNPKDRPPLPPPPEVVVTTLPKQSAGSSQSEVHGNGVRNGHHQVVLPAV